MWHPRYGDDFANVGSVHKNPSGQYLLRRATDCGKEPGYEAGDGDGQYQGYINSPTTDGTIIVRILVKNNGSDLTYVQSVLEACKLTPLNRTNTSGDAGDPFSNPKASFAGYEAAGANTSLAVMELLAQLAFSNPPMNRRDIGHVNKELEAAGVFNGVYKPPPGVNLTYAYAKLSAAIETYATTAIQHFGNGWIRNVPQGIYASNYLARATIAAVTGGYLEQTTDQVLYVFPDDRNLMLATNQSYIYTFSRKPPVASDGFWSLTLYDSQGAFVVNPENKYEVGDRSNITYPDGKLVYGGDGTSDADGAFQVLVQPYSVPPPANWTSNWLPAPADSVFLLPSELSLEPHAKY